MSDTEGCFCGYLTPSPRSDADKQCIYCEKLKVIAKQKAAADLEELVTKELSLPDGHTDRIFTDEEIRATGSIFCDKTGRFRVLLRELRKRLNLIR